MKLSKFNRFLVYYFLLALPVGLIGTYIFQIQEWPEPLPLTDNLLAATMAIGYLTLVGIWALSALLIIGQLIFSTTFRESLLKSLMFMRERDEREEFISQKASQSSFLFTLDIVLALLLINVNVPTPPKENAQTMSARFHAPGLVIFRDSASPEDNSWKIQLGQKVDQQMLESTGSSGSSNHKIYLAIVLLAQISSYFYFARKAQKN